MDKITLTLLRYEWKAFVRNRFQLLILAATFLLGMYAIYNGKVTINTQRATIEAVSALEEEEFYKYKISFQEELETLEQEQTHDIASRPAFAWYRHAYHAILPPHDYAALALGQRDLFRFYYRLTGMSLHYQLFENELANPVQLLFGNIDLSFVLIYLFPLLIIAFAYGLYAIEKENGTLALLLIQPVGMRKILLVRLGFYFAIITGLGLLIAAIGLLVAGSPWKAENQLPALAWLLSVVVYCAFWFSLVLLIISFRRSSSFSAITAAGCWLLLLIIIPAVLNVLVTVKYPISSTSLAGLTRRTSLENENDTEEARAVILEFLDHRPELAGADSLLHNDLLPKAYAAFTALKDVNHQHTVDHYNAQVESRHQWTSRFSWLSPAVTMQEVQARTAETELGEFLRFQDALVAFHRQITDFYFSRLFWDQPIALEDYSALPVFRMQPDPGRWMAVGRGIGQVSLAAFLFFLIGFRKLQQNAKP
jgi:ABC-2 type transport system permease protein